MKYFNALLLLCSTAAHAAYPAISTDLYNLFFRYTKYAAAAYASTCPQPPNGAIVVQYFSEASTDTQATLFRNDAQSEIVIAFRGTSDVQDFFTDFADALVPLTAVGTNCSGCKVHNGTQVAWNSVSSSVISAVKSQQSAYPSYNLTVTGHSLGAAIAALATSSMRAEGLNFLTYTMGEFRTGNPTWANYLDSLQAPPRYYRITHTDDGVPQATSPQMGYRHHSTEYWELEPFGASNTQNCPGQDNPNCNNATPAIGLLGDDGVNGINAAHLCYTGILIGNPVDAGASACNAASLLPQNCSTATGGGIVKL